MKTERHRIGLVLHARTRAQWRAWLAKNHDRAKEAWLAAYPKASGKPFVSYDAAVEEALCFGWIDSVVKPVATGVRAQRYTPRRAGSAVSELNRARVRVLVERGLMTPAGRAAMPDMEEWLNPPPLSVAPDILKRLRADAAAWKHYQGFSEAYRRIRIGWIEGARGRPDEFEKRLTYFVAMTAKGKRYGTVPE